MFFIKTLKLSFLLILLPLWMGLIFVLWFIPWVFTLYVGILFYFPYHSDGQTRFLRVAGPLTQIWSEEWVSSPQIPSFCRHALVASEDALFYDHYGVDWSSVEKNLKINEKAKKIKRGGSTITQQLVKNAFLGRERTYLRKAREMTGALILDATMEKNLQQTWYFNIIEFGPHIYGLEQASQFYFKVPAEKLNPSQCLALVSIIPSPRKWNRALINKQLTPFLYQRGYQILARMRQMGLASPKDLRAARNFKLW